MTATTTFFKNNKVT
jgi:hypothetical protein